MNAVAAYHGTHTRAVIEAAKAGAAGVPIDAALACGRSRRRRASR
jgi:hypothetical protein